MAQIKHVLQFFAVSAFVLLATGTKNASAQDSHYWTNQFGARSALMSGAVVGGVRDTSASYYNPAALAFVPNDSLSISANAYKYENLTLDNGAGTGDDLESDEIYVVPLLVSGSFDVESLEGHRFGYSILTKQRSQLKASDRGERIADVVNADWSMGPEEYIGQYLSDGDLMEVWGGLSWATKVSDNVSVGLTNYLALRTQERSESLFSRAINTDSGVASLTDLTTTLDYWNLRLLWKLGVAADYDPVRIGLVLTTPSIDLAGDGTTGADLTSSGMDVDRDGLPDFFVADDRQEDLDAEFRNPASIALGVDYQVRDDTVLAAAVEYYLPLGSYNVMLPEDRDFIRPTGAFDVSSRDLLRIDDSADNVFNWAVGVEHYFCPTIAGYLSVRSDYSYASDNSSGIPGASDWNLYHITLGTSMKRESSDISFGVVYSYGDSDDTEQRVDLSDASDENLLLGETDRTSSDYRAISLLLGYTYYF